MVRLFRGVRGGRGMQRPPLSFPRHVPQHMGPPIEFEEDFVPPYGAPEYVEDFIPPPEEPEYEEFNPPYGEPEYEGINPPHVAPEFEDFIPTFGVPEFKQDIQPYMAPRGRLLRGNRRPGPPCLPPPPRMTSLPPKPRLLHPLHQPHNLRESYRGMRGQILRPHPGIPRSRHPLPLGPPPLRSPLRGPPLPRAVRLAPPPPNPVRLGPHPPNPIRHGPPPLNPVRVGPHPPNHVRVGPHPPNPVRLRPSLPNPVRPGVPFARGRGIYARRAAGLKRLGAPVNGGNRNALKQKEKRSEESEVSKPWVTEMLKTEIHKKYRLFEAAREKKIDADAWKIFKEQRLLVGQMTTVAKLEYIGSHPEADINLVMYGNRPKGTKTM